jgi:hypothetical protein
MSSEQKITTDRLVRYANCGETRWLGHVFDPITNPADAIKLAEKLDIGYRYDPSANKGAQYRARWYDEHGPIPGSPKHTGPTLCAAICAAVDAVLEAK